MTSRRRMLLAAGAGLCLPWVCSAQQAGRVYRLGLFGFGAREGVIASFEPLLLLLAKSGFVRGSNLEVIYRIAPSDSVPLETAATELAASKLDAVVVPSPEGALALKKATSTLPIVALVGVDPVAEGLVSNLARPGGNITGVAVLAIETGNKRLELLKEVFPSARRVYWLTNGANMRYIELARPHASKLGLTLVPSLVEGQKDVEVFFARSFAADEAVHVGTSQINFALCERIAQLANRSRVRAVYPFAQCVDAGGLIAYASDFGAAIERIEHIVVQILNGTKPGEVPFEQAMHVNTIVNMKTARALGIAIPRAVLLRAQRIVE